ncbi:CCA tRNA nucleotidyltransferase [Lentibacter algarum]|uniref:CCA tRNA nucleotidyltransferase n=1 Tax=Lentibacter algarum TaxID=576131 RepID=UPI001C075A39|nr:CCA tRNA nucleotidyltransferase [Lentibacter algarum]
MSAAEKAGFEAYFVGGCVRNALLGLPVSDIDLATNARPDDVVALAKGLGFKPVPTGLDHGTITVVGLQAVLEVTTFRHDVETDGRHAVIAFSDQLEVDAKRRDFRMNALYADKSGKLYDPTGGLEDITAKRLQFVGNAQERIREDYLRIVRLFRFAAQLGFGAKGLDAVALQASGRLSYGLGHVSRERKTAELMKLLSAENPFEVLQRMRDCGVLHRVLPGASLAVLERFLQYEDDVHPLARLASLTFYTDTNQLRLSNAEKAAVATLKSFARSGCSPEVFAYRHGAELALPAVSVSSAVYGDAPSEPVQEKMRWAAKQSFPLAAQDLMPRYSGKALGDALKRAENAWISSGFTLGKQALLDEE